MKKILLILITLSVIQTSFSQQVTEPSRSEESSFKDGEWFKFRMSYSNWLKAGEATLKVNETVINNKPVFHVVGKGKTTGFVNWLFKVRDRYESYFDKQTIMPYKFVRNIDEGGHTKDLEIEFDQVNNKAHVHDKKHNKKTVIDTKPNIQDMVSTYYYFRNSIDISTLKKDDEFKIDMFFDEETYGFKLQYLGEETIKTEFGKIEALKFRPYVMAGRVFKEEESLTLWVSKDKNKVPLRIKADLAVGSLRADLEAFKGLKHPFRIVVDN